MTRLERLLPALAALSGTTLRVWRYDGRELRPLVDEAVPPPVPSTDTLERIPELEGTWLEVGSGKKGNGAKALADVIGAVLGAEREAVQVAAELSERYEEIDLIYTISEILGHTIRLDEAAHRILKEVATVVRARRATLMVHDPQANVLRLVAARGVELGEVDPIEVDDPCSIAARVFREMKIFSYDPSDSGIPDPGCGEDRAYRGRAFISVPVVYAAPGGTPKPIGVINLTDRLGADAFTAGDRKLVAAIANQIGAAVENARLVERDQGQQRVRREMELAHTEMFLSLFYAVIDPAAGRMAYANAGHPHAFLIDGRSGDVERLEATRPPLGLGVGGEEHSKPWRRREAILALFTDGLVDARNEIGERFGEPRVLSHVTNLRSRPAREILEAVFTDIAAFTGGAPATDDRTLVLLKA